MEDDMKYLSGIKRPDLDRIKEFHDDAKNFVCECGEVCDPVSHKWRWNGSIWEHHHGYPIGHVPVFRLNAPPSSLSKEDK